MEKGNAKVSAPLSFNSGLSLYLQQCDRCVVDQTVGPLEGYVLSCVLLFSPLEDLFSRDDILYGDADRLE